MMEVICKYHHQKILRNPDLLSPAVHKPLNLIMGVINIWYIAITYSTKRYFNVIETPDVEVLVLPPCFSAPAPH